MYYNSNTIVYFDGQWMKASDCSLNPYLATLHYGYGVFEGIRSYQTSNNEFHILEAEAHYERLLFSAKKVGIPFHYTVQELIDINHELLKKNKLTDSYIRPLVLCPPNMSLGKACESHFFMAAWEWKSYFSEEVGIRLQTSSIKRPSPNAFPIHAKVCGHYVNSIMASQLAKQDDYDEALLFDENNHVAEGPGANFFFEKNGTLFTSKDAYILPGITRNVVFKLCAHLGITIEEGNFSIHDIKQADAAFFCGTAAEITPCKSLDEYNFPLPWSKTVSTKIQKAYQLYTLQPAQSYE